MRIYPPKQTKPLHHHNLLTGLQKGRILEARGLERSYTQISEELKIPRSTVSMFLDRFKKRDSVENLPHTDRPRKTSKQFDHRLIRTALTDTAIPYTALCDITNSEVSTSTIHRRLQEDHIRN